MEVPVPQGPGGGGVARLQLIEPGRDRRVRGHGENPARKVGERGAEKRLLPYCADHGLATLINRPFQRSALLQQVKDTPLPSWAGELQATSWAQILLKFILAQPAVTVAIPATSKARYMADNLAAGAGVLPDERMRARMAAYFDSL